MQPKQGQSCGGDAVHALPAEVRVLEWCVDEHMAWREAGDEFVMIPGHVLRASEVVLHLHHVALLHIAFDVPTVVVQQRVKAAA